MICFDLTHLQNNAKLPRMKTANVGIIGDYNPQFALHKTTTDALEQAGVLLSAKIAVDWLPTDRSHDYRRFAGLFCSPGSPYRDLNGSLEGIRFAREHGVPFIGTCAGFQHAVLEFARNVLGATDAMHAEYDANASNLFLIPLTCSPRGKQMEVLISPGSKAAKFYGANRAVEAYYCNFGLNPAHEQEIIAGGMAITGRDADGEARIIELPSHPFFVGTLFVPQANSNLGSCHPLIVEFCRAALNCVAERSGTVSPPDRAEAVKRA